MPRPHIEEDIRMEEAATQLELSAEHVPTESEIDERFPNRPRNANPTLPFHTLYQNLFEPLLANVKKRTGFRTFSKKQKEPHEIRRGIIERFIARWKHEVGDDIYPLFRLIMPDKDRDRIVYGLKEKAIGKQLVKVLGMPASADDAYNLMNWKQPSQGSGNRGVSGDFPDRCYQAIVKRAMRTEPGNLTVGEVNDMLDQLALNTKEEAQLPIFKKFYENMNPQEMVWLIKIILKQMKVGATEKTFFDCWHPDAASLFNVSSSLKRVCWELYDQNFLLTSAAKSVNLMSCFVPQLAAFSKKSFADTVKAMRPEEEDKVFWIEEKMDGERMQMHLDENGECKFFSRKAKDYTDHYGHSLDDPEGTLTRYIKGAFNPNVKSIILDGEMITWDPVQDAMVAFGTLKTAVNIQRRVDDPTATRPLFKVFDTLYLNGQSLINYTLRDRRAALEKSVTNVHRRLEIHEYIEASTEEHITTMLRKVVAESTEGLVIKNPRSMYRLGERIDDWLKVKPEYTNEYGEDLDCIIIGGYYGEGKRGGMLSSFLCGLKADGNDSGAADHPRYFSFFKVGGGFTAADYATIRHRLEDHMIVWDSKKPPTDWIVLGGKEQYFEKPDVWIRPENSLIISVKAASITATDQFRTFATLRFPRFKKIRDDKDWTQAMTTSEFLQLKHKIEEIQEEKENKFTFERRRQQAKRIKKEYVIAGVDRSVGIYTGDESSLFDGQNFFVITESTKPKKTKAELEQLVKANSGKIYQSENGADEVRCIADKNVVKVAGLKKKEIDIIRPQWILDCIESRYLLPLEAGRHMLYMTPDTETKLKLTLDKYGDSYTRDVTLDDLRKILFEKMKDQELPKDPGRIITEFKLSESSQKSDPSPGWMFQDCLVYIDSHQNAARNNLLLSRDAHGDTMTLVSLTKASNIILFAGGRVTSDFHDQQVTHIICSPEDSSRIKGIRDALKCPAMISSSKYHGRESKYWTDSNIRRPTIPRITTPEWVSSSWVEKTLLDAENFLVTL